MEPLSKICEQAWLVGQELDLTGCGYGPSHVIEHLFITEPHQYYYFLAGLCKLVDAKNILEIGTHYGGSIKAMNLAVDAENIVTIDPLNHVDLPENIVKITAEGELDGTYRGLYERFANGLDVVFVDGVHAYKNTKQYLKQVRRLNPRFVVFDDIHLNEEMEKFWAEISPQYDSYDCSEESRREEGCGLGIIRLR